MLKVLAAIVGFFVVMFRHLAGGALGNVNFFTQIPEPWVTLSARGGPGPAGGRRAGRHAGDHPGGQRGVRDIVCCSPGSEGSSTATRHPVARRVIWTAPPVAARPSAVLTPATHNIANSWRAGGCYS